MVIVILKMTQNAYPATRETRCVISPSSGDCVFSLKWPEKLEPFKKTCNLDHYSQ